MRSRTLRAIFGISNSILICTVIVSTVVALPVDCASAAPVHPLFLDRLNYQAGQFPYGVCAADFDGDGTVDLAVSRDWTDPQIYILKGHGDGTFQAGHTYSLNNAASAIAGADVNGDHVPDIVVIVRLSNAVAVLLNNGDGTFQAPAYYNTGYGPTSLTETDLDGDGDIDIAVGDAGYTAGGGDSLSVLLNNGNGTFATAVRYDCGGPQWSVTSGDFDGDGDIDLVAGTGRDSIAVFMNAGSGTFGAPTKYFADSGFMYTCTGDFDGDGKLDLAAVNQNEFGIGDTLRVLMNNGDGSFRPGAKYLYDQGATKLIAADVDGDSRIDVITSNLRNPGSVQVFIGNGDGTFQPPLFFAAQAFANDVCAVDIDKDGDLDLVTANFFANTASILFNFTNYICGDLNGWNGGPDLEDLAYLINHLFHSTAAPLPLEAGNIDGDGVLDVADVVYLIDYLYFDGSKPTCK